MIVHAHAKINLTLEVLGRRADGYHEIRSVMRALTLHDTLHIEPWPAIEVECDLPGLDGPANLAFRAARILREATGYGGGARIVIAKAIPAAAGLGGGSSDAAATLAGLNRLWGTGLRREDLAALAATLGSDVAFFLYGGTALAGGRGEQIRPLADQADCPVLLVRPPLAVSTAAVYAATGPQDYADGAASERFAALPPDTPPRDWPLVNSLQAITCRLHPEVAAVLAAIDSWGALRALMCGSGATCFGLFESRSYAEAAAARARGHGWEAWVSHFVTDPPP
jgi:4-diphosphocytidyl-2-C-methyl-D-erythritol kinase